MRKLEITDNEDNTIEQQEYCWSVFMQRVDTMCAKMDQWKIPAKVEDQEQWQDLFQDVEETARSEGLWWEKPEAQLSMRLGSEQAFCRSLLHALEKVPNSCRIDKTEYVSVFEFEGMVSETLQVDFTDQTTHRRGLITLSFDAPANDRTKKRLRGVRLSDLMESDKKNATVPTDKKVLKNELPLKVQKVILGGEGFLLSRITRAERKSQKKSGHGVDSIKYDFMMNGALKVTILGQNEIRNEDHQEEQGTQRWEVRNNQHFEKRCWVDPINLVEIKSTGVDNETMKEEPSNAFWSVSFVQCDRPEDADGRFYWENGRSSQWFRLPSPIWDCHELLLRQDGTIVALPDQRPHNHTWTKAWETQVERVELQKVVPQEASDSKRKKNLRL